MNKLSQILNAIKIGAAVAKTIATGKTAKTLEKVEKGVEIAEIVKQLFPPKQEGK